MLVTAAFGATFVGMQAFEWTKLIMEGVRPWGNPWGAAQFGSSFFMITGFHGTHVTIGVIFLIIIARKVWRGDFDVEGRGFFTSRRELRDASKSWVSTGTSSIWCGCSSLPFSIFGEERHGEQRQRHGHAWQKGNRHPIKLYLVVWGWLFVLSTCSYLVDYFGLQDISDGL